MTTTYYKDELSEIVINNPTLLSFKVSDEWVDGMMIYDRETINQIIDSLKSYNDPSLDDIIDKLEYGL